MAEIVAANFSGTYKVITIRTLMLLPAEIESKTLIPALRAILAKNLSENHDVREDEISKMLGVTQAAISNYIRGTRGDPELIKKLTAKYHPYTFIKWLFLFGSLFVFPFGYKELSEVNWNEFTPYIWFSTIFVVVFATFATYLLNPLALRKLSATTVSTFVYVQPVFAGVFAVIMGSDSVSTIKIVATLLIFLGVYLVTKNSTQRSPK